MWVPTHLNFIGYEIEICCFKEPVVGGLRMFAAYILYAERNIDDEEDVEAAEMVLEPLLMLLEETRL